MIAPCPEIIERARSHYYCPASEAFYQAFAGGEHGQVGWYDSIKIDLAEGQRRSVGEIMERFSSHDLNHWVLNLGAGCGSAARYLARNRRWRIDCFSPSFEQNEQNRKLNREKRLQRLIHVRGGNFEDLPYVREVFDSIWSQDVLIYCPDRFRVLEEVDRVLKPGGNFVFTDIMQFQDSIDPFLTPVLAPLHLENLASQQFYLKSAQALGWELLSWTDASRHLHTHYRKILEELSEKRVEMSLLCGETFIERTEHNLRDWLKAASLGRLVWGIWHFRKPLLP